MSMNNLELNPETDSFLVVKYTGLHSAAFELVPSNVSPAQLFALAKVLEWQAVKQLEEEYAKRNKKPGGEILVASAIPDNLNAK